MDKKIVLNEIRRIAAANGGRAPGSQLFATETGTSKGDWYPHIWIRWSDAVKEAGLEPNKFNERHVDNDLLEKYALYVKEIGRIPVSGDIRVKAKNDPLFPAHNALTRFGSKWDLLEAVIQFVGENPNYDDVANLCKSYLETTPRRTKSRRLESQVDYGYVYLMKSGKHFKIGRTDFPVGHREYQLGIMIPIPPDVLHYIKTDDPKGVGEYWHNRFAQKRRSGRSGRKSEWFDLTNQDVAAFKRWKNIA